MTKLKSIHWKAWLCIALLISLALIYTASALRAPMMGENDYWSNLLPIIHFRKSILSEHTLPLFTNLWYGGRAQWQNPLWSFLYLPSTLIWLAVPLDWGARIVIEIHLIFSLLAGRKLSSLFLTSELGRIPAAIILTSPILRALAAGHIEIVMCWGWLLLSLYLLLDEKRPMRLRGVCSGLCWGTMALTGANYHVFFAGLLLVPLAISIKKPGLFFSLLGGASIGLLHLPGVWHLIGVERADPALSIATYQLNLSGVITSLTAGFAQPLGWRSWALIGIPIAYLFLRSGIIDIRNVILRRTITNKAQKLSLIVSLILFILFATGTIYKGHHLLDTFRVPVRAISLAAMTIVLYVLLSYKQVSPAPSEGKQSSPVNWFLIASVIQIGILAGVYIRPTGALHGPYDSEAQKLANFMVDQQAKSVWVDTIDLSDMYIHVVLTDNGISLPNVYYGDMGQEIPVQGPYCGYSFDHILSPQAAGDIVLASSISNQILATIPSFNLEPVARFTFDSEPYQVYRVVCPR